MVFILFTINFWGVPVVFGEPREMSYPGFQSSWLQILHHLHLRSLEKIQFLIPLFWLRKNQTSGQITITTCILIYIYVCIICQQFLPEISNFGFPFRTRSRARHCRHDDDHDRCQASLSMGGGGGKLLLACFEKVLPWCSHGTFRRVDSRVT